MGLRAPDGGFISGIGKRERAIIRAQANQVGAPYNFCVEASTALTNALRADGFSAHLLHCTGLKTLAPDADMRWHDLAPQSRWAHFLVKIGEEVVDLTRRQFFPASAFPYVQSISACAAEWDDIALSIVRPRQAPNDPAHARGGKSY